MNSELCQSVSKMPETKNRSLDTMETSNCTIEPHAENENEQVHVYDFQIRDTCIMNGIANIQNTLANFMLHLDGQDLHIDKLTKEMRTKNGINDRLENVQEQSNDTLYIITEVQEKQKKQNKTKKDGERNNKAQGFHCKT